MSHEAVAAPTREWNRCFACGSSELSLIEVVPINALAEAWTSEQQFRCGISLGRDAWFAAVAGSLRAAAIRFDQCQDCGTEVASPRRSWEEDVYPEDERYPVRWEFERFLQDLGPAPVTVLELGCGSGTFLSEAQRRGHCPIGIDFNRRAAALACSRGLEVICGGFDRLREHLAERRSDQTFGAISMFHVIEHLSDPDCVFEELAGFARSGTKLGISCPGPRRFTQLIREEQVGARDFWDYPPHHVIRWTIPGLHQFLEARGWRVLRAIEEPLPWVGAASQIAITRAIRRGYIGDGIRRRLAIAWAMVRVLASLRVIKGLSLYIFAERPGA
jgi:SAM-dependent methyltransferase